MSERNHPDLTPDERTALLQFLQYYRDTLAVKVDGLTDAQAANPACPPSILTLTGLVRHMAEVERHWFRRSLRAEYAPPIFYSEARPDGDLDLVDPTTSLADSIDAWQSEIVAADAILANAPDLDELATIDRHGRRPNLRWILVHMIEEYARHAGHADLLRERIDGATGD